MRMFLEIQNAFRLSGAVCPDLPHPADRFAAIRDDSE